MASHEDALNLDYDERGNVLYASLVPLHAVLKSRISISLASRSRLSTLVMTFVLTPHMRCILPQACCWCTMLYLWST